MLTTLKDLGLWRVVTVRKVRPGMCGERLLAKSKSLMIWYKTELGIRGHCDLIGTSIPQSRSLLGGSRDPRRLIHKLSKPMRLSRRQTK